MGDSELLRACRNGDVAALDRLIAGGLTADAARADDNNALHFASMFGKRAIVNRLLDLGLGIDDVRARHNSALRFACTYGAVTTINRLLGLGLTADDVRARDNHALRTACFLDKLEVVESLLSFGLGADVVRSMNYDALRQACIYGRAAIACALAACLGGERGPPPDLQAATLKLIIREPEDARRAETRLAAARAVATWTGHEEALASLGAEAEAAWEALCAEATLGVLRFAD